MQNKARPKYLNLFTLGAKMSVTAKVSILHRVSGILLVLSLPILLYILQRSLLSADFYSVLYGCFSNPIVKLIYLVLIWAFIYHVCSGVRFLFLDISRGVEVKIAQKTARIVIVLSIILTIIMGWIIW